MNQLARRQQISDMLYTGVRQLYTSLTPDGGVLDPANSGFVREAHAMREILFVLDGECSYMLNGMIYPALPGAAFFFDSWEPHGAWYRAEDQSLYHVWIHFHKAHISLSTVQVLSGGHTQLFGKPLHLSEEFFSPLVRRWDEYVARKDCPGRDKIFFLGTPLNLLLEDYALRTYDNFKNSTADNSDITIFMRSYIENMHGRDCSLDKLEKICGYSRFHLSHLFHQRVGMSIGDYIHKVRRRFVLAALQRGLKQKEIAIELGFSTPAAFWLWRKKHMEIS